MESTGEEAECAVTVEVVAEPTAIPVLLIEGNGANGALMANEDGGEEDSGVGGGVAGSARDGAEEEVAPKRPWKFTVETARFFLVLCSIHREAGTRGAPAEGPPRLMSIFSRCDDMMMRRLLR